MIGSALLRMLIMTVSLMLLPLPTSHGVDKIAVEYQPDSGFSSSCSTGGTTLVSGSQEGKTHYVQVMMNTTACALPVVTSNAFISDITGCTIVWNSLYHDEVEYAPGASYRLAEFAVRPTSSTWSFKMGFDIAGDLSVFSFEHTFFEGGISLGVGAQLESSYGWVANGHETGTYINYAYVGEPYALRYRTTNRSALQDLTITSPGWSVVGTPYNCSITISDQPPSTLATDQSAVTVFQVTPASEGFFGAQIQIITNDPTSPFTISFNGDANPAALLTFLNGDSPVNPNSEISVTGAYIGESKHLIFHLRNDDIVPITFSASANGVKCTTTTSTLPTTLAVGEKTAWEITVTPTAADWYFLPSVSITSPSIRTKNWSVGDHDGADTYVPSKAKSSNGTNSCGMGGGISSLLLLALGVWALLRLSLGRMTSA